MTAVATPRRPSARGVSLVEPVEIACRLRDEWLRTGLSTAPADRDIAQRAVTELYRLVGQPPPQFVWVPSPAAAVELLRDDPDAPPGGIGIPPSDEPFRNWPLIQRLIGIKSGMRRRMIERTEPEREWWLRGPSLPAHEWAVMSPRELLAAGISAPRILDNLVHLPLQESLRDSMYRPMRTELLGPEGRRTDIAGYEQYDTWTVAFHDVNRVAGLARYRDDDAHQLDQWVALARHAGWWWPGPRRCVLSERPVAVHTEAQQSAWYGEVRLHNDAGPAVEFADGAGVFALHGTFVPEWVFTDLTVERVLATRNIEVRRAAVERLGWDEFIDRAGLTLLSTAADPGNPGAELRLYDNWRDRTRVLLVVNGSRERDGTRRRYGLNVPVTIGDPVAAAGWSYGLTGAQYAQLLRRT
ncbi:DUF6745 domain-containing protein [Nocardia sp. NPDC058058]|uniref:DUF6745 domain-containing protein n=1 Tax=Nocardia sp. NPDC058058 TaxID=3346317 RepID=UPI0036DF2067